LGTLSVSCFGNLKVILSVVAVVAIVLSHRQAVAEITIAKDEDWDLNVDGRVNAFIAYAAGDKPPRGVAEWTAGISEQTPPNSGEIATVRVRTGFIQNVLGISYNRRVADGYKLTIRYSLWAGASNQKTPILGQQADVQAREAYVKLEAPWGTILAGRDLGLFARGGISMDAEIVHANGLGSPCTTKSILGGACGFAGHGVLFPAFNAGILYSTPKLAGFQATVGLYDPSVNIEKGYEITPYPRFEAQLAYNLRDMFKVFAEAMWQRLVNIDPLKDADNNPIIDTNGKPKDQIADANGFAAGASLNLGVFQVGGSFYTGTGLTMIVPILNTPIFSDQRNILRKGQGFAGMAALNLGSTKIAGGAGISQLKLTNFDQEPFSQIVPPKQQLGISIGLYQTFFKQLTWAVEYFRGQYTWYQYQETATSDPTTPTQNMNFFNTGLTAVF
jgi:hypothetical protein